MLMKKGTFREVKTLAHNLQPIGGGAKIQSELSESKVYAVKELCQVSH